MGASLLGTSIVVLLGAVIVGALVVTLVASIVRWKDRVKLACCGACRYPVEGLGTFTCPECGADFRNVGILVPGMRPKHRIYVAEILAAWAVIAAFGGFMTVGIVGGTPAGQRLSFSRNEVLTPKSSVLGQISVMSSGTADVNASANTAPAQRMLIQGYQTSVTTPVLLDIDLKGQTWECRPSAGPIAGWKPIGGALPIKPEEVAAWLNTTGMVKPGASAPQAESTALATYINNGGKLADSLVLGSTAGTIGMRYAPASWVIAWSAVLWVVIFVIGSAIIARAHTTKRRKAAARPSAAAA